MFNGYYDSVWDKKGVLLQAWAHPDFPVLVPPRDAVGCTAAGLEAEGVAGMLELLSRARIALKTKKPHRFPVKIMGMRRLSIAYPGKNGCVLVRAYSPKNVMSGIKAFLAWAWLWVAPGIGGGGGYNTDNSFFQ